MTIVWKWVKTIDIVLIILLIIGIIVLKGAIYYTDQQKFYSDFLDLQLMLGTKEISSIIATYTDIDHPPFINISNITVVSTLERSGEVKPDIPYLIQIEGSPYWTQVNSSEASVVDARSYYGDVKEGILKGVYYSFTNHTGLASLAYLNITMRSSGSITLEVDRSRIPWAWDDENITRTNKDYFRDGINYFKTTRISTKVIHDAQAKTGLKIYFTDGTSMDVE